MGYQDVEGGGGKGGSGVSGGSEGGSGVSGGSEGGDSEGEDGGGEGVGGEGVGGENGGGEGGGDEEGGGEGGVGDGGFRRPVCYAGRRACAWRRARAREGSRKPLVNCSKAATRSSNGRLISNRAPALGNKGTKRRHPSTHTLCVRTGRGCL